MFKRKQKYHIEDLVRQTECKDPIREIKISARIYPEPGKWILKLSMNNKNVLTGIEGILHCTVPIDEYVTEKRYLNKVSKSIEHMLYHEAMEWFRFKGKRVLDPHK